MEKCLNCESKVTGVFNNNQLLSEQKNTIINIFSDNLESIYCNNCGDDLYRNAKTKVLNEKNSLIKEVEALITLIPVISAHSPLNWNYEILNMVTGQSTTGTGVISEFTSSFTDLFGVQSSKLNSKLKNGEELCFSQLRKNCIDIGGNAVIASDIDYSEVGGDKGILMVCMGGTAVKLLNLEILGVERSKGILRLTEANIRLNRLSSFEIPEY